MGQIEQEICKKYNVWKKNISDKTVFKLLEILNQHFIDVRIYNCEFSNCNYDTLIQIGEDEHVEEEPPKNIGCGWGLRHAILNLLLCDKIWTNGFAVDDIRWVLMSLPEKVKAGVI